MGGLVMPSGLELYKPDGTLAFSTPRGDRPCYLLYAIPFIKGDFTPFVVNGVKVYRKTYTGLDPTRMVTLNDDVQIIALNTLQLKSQFPSYQTIYIMGW